MTFFKTARENLRRLWVRADGLAARTPTERNRYVDFLRAASICVVVFGHWLVAAPFIQGGELVAGHMLALAPWTHWLTLVVQVMPVFFFVGGYANAMAWDAARRDRTPYSVWLGLRLRRLLVPVLPVLLVWTGLASLALFLGTDSELLTLLSQAALVPTWFLAVYMMVGVLVPVLSAAWTRFGLGSIAALIAAAVVTDALAFNLHSGIGYVNYGFVWLAIHQLGFAWRAGQIRRPLFWAAGGLLATAGLVLYGPYPLAMVGVPGAAVGNTTPPTLALLALGVAQMGLVLSLEAPARRLLARRKAWTATVLVNGMIMTLYLWHMTALLIALGVAYGLDGFGLNAIPNSAIWWAVRPLWMAAFVLCLVPLIGFFARHEQRAPGAVVPHSRRRLVTGAALSCCGLYMLSKGGVVSGAGLRVIPALMPLVGAGLASFGPLGGILGRSR